MLDFSELKKIRIPEVLSRYGVSLRYRGEWASAPCPLPTHKTGDKARTFTVNLQQNYWRCFSESCNEKNGGRKGGDVINLNLCIPFLVRRSSYLGGSDSEMIKGSVQVMVCRTSG